MSAADEDLADFAVNRALASGASYAEAYLLNEKSSSIAIEQGVFNGAAATESSGMRVRLIKKGRLFTFSTNVLSKEGIEASLRRASLFKGNSIVLSREKVRRANYKAKQKKSFDSENPAEDLAEYDRQLAKNKLVRYRSMYLGYGISNSYFTNSDGTKIRATLPSISSFFSLILKSGSETRQRFLQYGGVGGYELFDLDKIGGEIEQEVKNLANVMSKGVSLSKSKLAEIRNVVVSPEISGIAVHESIGHPNEADRVFGREAAQAGTSYLNGSNLGMQIGSGAVNIVDDPTIEGAYGFYLYDDEGVMAGPKLIVKDGMQNELLLNREYAGMLGRKSNGSARSSDYSVEPIIRMSNTYLKPGNADFEDLIEEAGSGVYIKSFTEWNIDDTRSFAKYQGNEAYLIERGSIGKPVKNFSLEVSTFNFWKSVRLVDNEFKLYLGTCGKGEPEQGVPVTMGGAAALLSFGE